MKPFKFYKDLVFTELESNGLHVDSVRAWKVPGADSLIFVVVQLTDYHVWTYGSGDDNGNITITQYKYYPKDEIIINECRINAPELVGWFPEYHDYEQKGMMRIVFVKYEKEF